MENGQIEFVGGGFCENDDAVSYYEDIIVNMELGHQFLKKTFNITPTVGWNIDNFGHTAGHAYLFSQMGFYAQFISRIHYDDWEKRKKEKTLEFIWKPPLSVPSYLYTYQAFANFYHCPIGFCFESGRCFPTGEYITEDNVKRRAEEFVNYFREMEQSYRFSNVFQFMGDDMTYQSAGFFFENIDRLINYINSHFAEYKMHMIYSTPSDYLNAIHSELEKQTPIFPIEPRDLLPIADIPHSY